MYKSKFNHQSADTLDISGSIKEVGLTDIAITEMHG